MKAGLSGVVLGIAVVAITGVALFALDRLTGGDGVGGLAASTTAGNQRPYHYPLQLLILLILKLLRVPHFRYQQLLSLQLFYPLL